MRTLKKNKNKNKKEKRARHKTQASASQKIPFFSQKVHTTHNTTEGLSFHSFSRAFSFVVDIFQPFSPIFLEVNPPLY
jgi:hypothetical protein|tara:strand:+ start:88 stop:321 length:234 start_codon:yes stop_codon:yes gene_type:complete